MQCSNAVLCTPAIRCSWVATLWIVSFNGRTVVRALRRSTHDRDAVLITEWHAAKQTSAYRFPGSCEGRSTGAVVGSTTKCRRVDTDEQAAAQQVRILLQVDLRCDSSVPYLQASFCYRMRDKSLHHQGMQAAHSARLSALLLIALI